jgi:hypothetical protein
MRTRWILIILGILLIGGAVFLFTRDGGGDNLPGGNGTTTGSTTGGNGGENPAPVENSQIRVDSPLLNALVSSPMRIRGEARGTWYFEASFPVKLLDANGKILTQAPAQAQGEWMTTNFVPFDFTLAFPTPTTATGVLVLEKDNPSGLPEHADEVRVPVRFAGASTTARTVKLFFYNEDHDQDLQGNTLCSAKGLVSFDRSVPFTNTPIQEAIKALLAGPIAQEKAQAPDTEFPLPGVSLTSASLSNGVLTLTFADPQNKTSGGSCRVSVLRAQIEATAKQFSGVQSVRFAPTGVFEP